MLEVPRLVRGRATDSGSPRAQAFSHCPARSCLSSHTDSTQFLYLLHRIREGTVPLTGPLLTGSRLGLHLSQLQIKLPRAASHTRLHMCVSRQQASTGGAAEAKQGPICIALKSHVMTSAFPTHSRPVSIIFKDYVTFPSVDGPSLTPPPALRNMAVPIFPF